MKLREERTVSTMVSLYCRRNHNTNDTLCGSCSSLLAYALGRLACCPLKPDKPVCSNCTIHCYEPLKRESIRDVMRYAGPRIMFRHPMLALAYLKNKLSSRQH